MEGDEIVERSKKIYMIGKYRKKVFLPVGAIFYILFGLILIVGNLFYMWIYTFPIDPVVILLGLLFVGLGLYVVFKKDKLNC